MSGGGHVRARWLAIALVGLLLSMCGAAAGQAAPASQPVAQASAPAPVTTLVPAAAEMAAAAAKASAHADTAHPDAARADTASGHADVAYDGTAHAAYTVGAKDSAHAPEGDGGPGSSRCHKSKGDDGGLPAAPTGGSQQTPFLALPACLVPESHAALGTAHARPPVRGPAPAIAPTPVELSVLRV